MKLSLFFVCSYIQACPTQCRCDNKHRIYCNDRELIQIPLDIPVSAAALFLQDNQINSGISESKETKLLSRLTNLETVKLFHNRLDQIPIFNSRYLRYLELSKNRIESISSVAFDNCANVEELNLSSNLLKNSGCVLT